MAVALRAIQVTAIMLAVSLAGYFAGTIYFSGDRQGSAITAPEGQLADTLPKVELADLAGQKRSLDEWAGNTLVINFWATWCAPCRREMPLLQHLHEQRQGQAFSVIGIAVDRFSDVESFIGEIGVTYPVLVGQQDAIDAAGQFGQDLVGLPLTVFVAPSGQVLKIHAGELEADELGEILKLADQVANGALDPGLARKTLAAR